MNFKGMKLPFKILDLDDDAPFAIQRNFNEIEYYLNNILRGVKSIEESIMLLDFAPLADMGIGDMGLIDDEIIDTHPPLEIIECVLQEDGQMGSIDVAIKTDEYGGIKETWIARVINNQAVIEVHDTPDNFLKTPARTFTIPTAEGGEVVDVAIEFTGETDALGIFVSHEAPHIFWVERTINKDSIYSVEWDGEGSRPAAFLLSWVSLNERGIGEGLDASITV